MQLDIKEIFTSFMVLFAVIDIFGSTPIVINMKAQGKYVNAGKAALISYLVMVIFLFAGEALLQLFNVDISSFAIAGALILFVLAVEMILSIEIFRNDGPEDSVTIVPFVFPLIAGAGTLTTALSLRAECHIINIILGITLNILLVFIVLKNVYLVERLLGKTGIYILRKLFGIILLAMSVKLFISNLSILLNSLKP